MGREVVGTRLDGRQGRCQLSRFGHRGIILRGSAAVDHGAAVCADVFCADLWWCFGCGWSLYCAI